MHAEHFITRVADFHRKHDAPVGHGASFRVVNLRKSLIYEEAGEVMLAAHDRNELELVDGLGDLLYVAAGLWVAVIGDGEYPPGVHIPSLTPPPLWSDDFFCTLDRRVNLVVGGTAHLYELHFENVIHNAMYVLGELGYDPIGVFDEIHSSNMTKTPTKGDIRVRVKGPDYRAPDLTRFLRGA